MINFPIDISDIIYGYADIESKEPSRIDELCLPVICSKQKILERYLDQYNLKNKSKSELKHIDLDLWSAKHCREVNKVLNDDDFVLDGFCENKNFCDPEFGEYQYVVSKK